MKDPLAVIYNENWWRISKVSLLFNLEYSELKLKQYATKIRQELATDATSPNSSVVTVESLPSLKYAPQDPSGLQITVKANEKVVYVAIFLSWGNSVFHENLPITHLPYMLERGTSSVGDSVKNAIRKMFDCTITLFYFTEAMLVDLMFSLVDGDSSRPTDPFVLGYKTEADFQNKATVTFEIGDIHRIWNYAKENFSEDSEELLSTSFAYLLLRNQLFHMCELDVTRLDLWEVRLPKAEIKCKGVVNMKTPEIINSVLNVLNGYF